ncbi:MAG: type I restriction endonuclease subunit R [Fusobacterium sp. JB019]|nr:type I restriction endonuclease subunit R [Fusobacterium sp. JB019]
MSIESEATLENKLIEQLSNNGYSKVTITNEFDLHENFKKQLEKYNEIFLTDREFDKVLIHLQGDSIFEKAKKLRRPFPLQRDDGDMSYIEFFNQEDFSKNIFQVTNQVTMEGTYKNRYDVTILINGIPMVQIELKKRGIELKQAFNQINRYQDHSYKGLFNYIQIFVISNGVNTKYYSNNKDQSFKQTFYWTDENNKKISNLKDFTNIFLDKEHLNIMISKYIVLHETCKILMVLRPYQYYAVERILDTVHNSPNSNGYIWHTTGSGKTLTSFKASQILITKEEIDKVIFVVDRKDLDNQTMEEFNSFSKGSIDGTDSTKSLVSQLTDNTTPLVITTIQKLNNAISKHHLETKMKSVKDKRLIFIFDECHRSQFGDTHKKINNFFTSKQFFGFTGTPIFAVNAIHHKTTADLFEKPLHKYTIKDAIADDNVLGFSVEYYNTFKSKKLQDENGDDRYLDDIKVEGINTKEVFEAQERLENIVDFIISNHCRKTRDKEFNSIFAVNSIETLLKYYDIFKSKDHDLNIATIFTYADNEDNKNANGIAEEKTNKHTRERLDEIVNDYNKTFGTNHNLNKDNGFNAYFVDLSKKVKEKKIDILLVVNMFLTGFDSPRSNTLYVDKNLKYHNLIQAFSRTNRLLNETKSYGNIVCFRNLKKNTDEAIELYSNLDAKETVLMKDYREYVKDFNKYVDDLITLAPDVNDINDLNSEDDKYRFIEIYRNLLRVLNKLTTFSKFSYDDLNMTEQTFNDYKSKYLDLHYEVNKQKEKVSILNDIDFEIELTRKDYVNVSYIISLIKNLNSEDEGFLKDKEFILKTIESNPELRSKKELIEQFIEENRVNIVAGNKFDIEEKLKLFLQKEKERQISEFIALENLREESAKKIISDYEFSSKFNVGEIKKSFLGKVGLKEKREKINNVKHKIEEIMNTFNW